MFPATVTAFDTRSTVRRRSDRQERRDDAVVPVAPGLEEERVRAALEVAGRLARNQTATRRGMGRAGSLR